MKHITAYLILLCALSMTNSCSSGKQQTTVTNKEGFPMIIPFESGVKNIKTIKLSDIAEKVEWVPLETTDSSLVARPKLNTIALVDGRIYIPCSMGLLSFSEDGKFTGSIARKGQGPGEYANVLSIAANPAFNHVYLLSPGKVLTYESDGTFVSESQTPVGWQFTVMNDSIYLMYIHNNTGQRKDRLLIMDNKGDTLQHYPQPDRFEVPNGMNWFYTNNKESFLYTYQDVNVFHDYYCDTLYTVTPDSLSPRFILQMGKYKLPADLRLETKMLTSEKDQSLKKAESYLRPTLFETDRYLVMPYTTWNIVDNKAIPQLMIYDRNKQECIHAKNDVIINDMNGNIPFYPTARIADNVLMGYMEASDLIEKIEEGAELPESLNGLKEDDNPILMLVYLKK